MSESKRGYRLSATSKAHRGPRGDPSHCKITSIALEKKSDTVVADPHGSVSYDDILLITTAAGSATRHEEEPKLKTVEPGALSEMAASPRPKDTTSSSEVMTVPDMQKVPAIRPRSHRKSSEGTPRFGLQTPTVPLSRQSPTTSPNHIQGLIIGHDPPPEPSARSNRNQSPPRPMFSQVQKQASRRPMSSAASPRNKRSQMMTEYIQIHHKILSHRQPRPDSARSAGTGVSEPPEALTGKADIHVQKPVATHTPQTAHGDGIPLTATVCMDDPGLAEADGDTRTDTVPAPSPADSRAVTPEPMHPVSTTPTPSETKDLDTSVQAEEETGNIQFSGETEKEAPTQKEDPVTETDNISPGTANPTISFNIPTAGEVTEE